MSGFPVHSCGQCAISLWFDSGVQEGDGSVLLVFLHCKLYGRVNTINVLKEALFVYLLVEGVIHIPTSELLLTIISLIPTPIKLILGYV